MRKTIANQEEQAPDLQAIRDAWRDDRKSKLWPKILVVDDEPAYTNLVKRTLEIQCHYRVSSIHDPHLAHSWCRELQPDVMILDVTMPEVGGYEIAKKIRQDPECSNTRVILVTAMYRPQEFKDAFAGSEDEVIVSKLAQMGELVKAIESELALAS